MLPEPATRFCILCILVAPAPTIKLGLLRLIGEPAPVNREPVPVNQGPRAVAPCDLYHRNAFTKREAQSASNSPGTKIGKSAPDELHTRVNGNENPGKRARAYNIFFVYLHH